MLPLDDKPALDLMQSPGGARLAVQDELIAAAGAQADDVRFVPRHDCYALAAKAHLIVRTGEIRTYGNAVLRDGVVTTDGTWRH